MIERLTPEGYEQTNAKLANLERRLAALEGRQDLTPSHRDAARRSYRVMMARYRSELELFEVVQSPANS